MSSYKLSMTSLRRLQGVHPTIILVVVRALQLSRVDFLVGRDGGLRTEQRQRELIAEGASETMKSYHLPQDDGMSHAVDLWPWLNGGVPWEDVSAFREIHDSMRQAANEFGVTFEWGGYWEGLRDMPHFQFQL